MSINYILSNHLGLLYQVGMMAHSPSFMQTLAGEMEAEGHRVLLLPTDLTESEQIARDFARTKEELGPVDVLINHAGNAAWKDFMELTLDDLEQAWRICVGGSFLCSQAVIGDMVERGRGSILFTGATSSIRGRAFSSAKFAVRGLAESLAKKFWPQGALLHERLAKVLKTAGSLVRLVRGSSQKHVPLFPKSL